MKQKEPIQMRRWRRMWLLLLVCLLGSISPSWADTWHFQGSSEHVVVNSPTLDKPYMQFVAMYFDKTESTTKNYHGFFTTTDKPSGAPSSAPNGPALFINGKYACSPIDELLAGDNRAGAAWDACSTNGWWGGTYYATIDNVKYTIKFYNPYHSGSSKRCLVNILIFPEKIQDNMTYTVKLAGWWKIMWKQDPPKEESQTWTFSTTPSLGLSSPTIVSSEYGKIIISGSLKSAYGPTTVGSYKNATTGGLLWSDNLNSSHTYSKGDALFNNLPIDFSERSNYYKSATKYIEYIIENKNYSPSGFDEMSPKVSPKYYQWYSTTVPGFIKASEVAVACSNLWEKKVKITWKSAAENNNSSTQGTWSIFCYSTDDNSISKRTLAEGIANDKREYVVVAPVYDKKCTYEVAFIPTNGVQRSELTDKNTFNLERGWGFSDFTAALDNNNHIVLNWRHTAIGDATASDPYTLSIQRSTNYDVTQPEKATWTEIATKEIKNNNVATGSFTDLNLVANTTYSYRIVATLLEKTFTSEVRSVGLEGTQIKSFSATRGTYSTMVKLRWEVKQAGETTTL